MNNFFRMLYMVCGIVFICIPSFVCAADEDYTVERRLSLEESIKLALLNNRDLLMAKEEVEIIKQKATEVLAFRYPQVDMVANYSRYKLESPIYVNPPTYGNTVLTKGKDELYMGRVELNQLLYAGRRFENTRKSSDISMRRAKSEYEKTKGDVILKTKTNFYTYQLNLVRETFVTSTLSSLTQSATTFCRNQDDMWDVQQYLDSLADDLNGYTIARDNAKLDFLDTIGVDFNTMIAIDQTMHYEAPVTYDCATCIARALQLRPELLKSQAQEELGMLEMNISMAERNPIVMLGAGYQYTSNLLVTDSTYWAADWDVNLSVSLPIFDGGAWLSRNKQKQSNLRKITIKRVAVEEQIKKEVQKAFLQYIGMKKRWDLVRVHTGDIQARHAVLDKKLRDGVVAWQAWFPEKKHLIDETLDAWQALYDYNISIVQLHFVIGD